MSESDADWKSLRSAFEQALASYNEGGLPIGAVMVKNGVIVATGATGVCRTVIPLLTERWIASERRAAARAMMALRCTRS